MGIFELLLSIFAIGAFSVLAAIALVAGVVCVIMPFYAIYLAFSWISRA